MEKRIQVPCHWCLNETGYTIEECKGHDHVIEDRSCKKFYAMCGKCFHTSPLENSRQELINLVQSGPDGGNLSTGECLWCAVGNAYTIKNTHRIKEFLKAQGIPNLGPIKRTGLYYGMCKSCHHCAPTVEGSAQSAQSVINTGVATP